jgi:AP2-like factor, euAP2 lineage
MRVIPLTRKKVAIVDDEDYAELIRWKWHCSSHGYAVRTPGGRKSRKIIFMNRQVMNATKGASVVFKDNNPLNCRKENLLVGDAATVQHKKRRLPAKTSSQYKGVFRDKRRQKWFAQIKVAGKAKYLGSYRSEEQAARAYDDAARHFFGTHAFTNFPYRNRRAGKLNRRPDVCAVQSVAVMKHH